MAAFGAKEKPVVIWKSKNPRGLQRFDKSVLPVNYFDQKNAWMTSEILEEILRKLNCRLALLIAPFCFLWIMQVVCQPSELASKLASKFSHINVCFLPAHTTSKLQPLDHGIIKNF